MALVLGLFTLLMSNYFFNPALRTNLNTFDDNIAFYIDTLAATEDGRVRIPTESGLVVSVAVSYQEEGEYSGLGYEIPRDGWYVIVTYRLGGKLARSASMINTYTPDAGMSRNVISPRGVCIIKTRASQYAGVEEC